MRVSFDLPPSAVVALVAANADADTVGARVRFLAAVKLYERHEVSVGAAAEIAGIEMGLFLAQFQVLTGPVQ